MNKTIEYDTYEHRHTKKKVLAKRFKFGMEDGRDEIQGTFRPYVFGWDIGQEKKLYVNESDYIVITKSFSKSQNKEREFKLIFAKEIFLKFYRRVS